MMRCGRCRAEIHLRPSTMVWEHTAGGVQCVPGYLAEATPFYTGR